MIRTFATLVILFSLSIHGFTQANAPDSVNMVGKWTVCVVLKFSPDYNCTNGYVTYQFFQDKKVLDQRESIDGGGYHKYTQGKWSLIKHDLMIDMDDPEFGQFPPMYYKIIFINNDKFYSIGREGPTGTIVYTFFQRVE